MRETKPPQRSGAEIIIDGLLHHGVTTVAGLPGGAALPLYDAIARSPIRHVLARHEQGAGFIAQGMARVTGRAGVCLATSGPGATNLLTAIADAKLDSIPLVAITAQVPSDLIGTDAFQEVDTYSLSLPITKHSFAVRDARELWKLVPEALAIAETGRPGPVLLDVPKDVQCQRVDIEPWAPHRLDQDQTDVSGDDMDRLAAWIDAAERPVLYVGGGIVASGASAALERLAHRASIPVTTTLMGLGVFPPDDPLSLGMLGMHGSRRTNTALDECDLLIAVGVRFDDRATGRPDAFCANARIVHIELDAAEIGKIVQPDLAIAEDARRVLEALLPRVRSHRRDPWRARLDELERDCPSLPVSDPTDPRDPIALLRRLAVRAGPEAIVTTDVGQHQMWVAQVYPFERPRRLLTSGGLGTMGFGLPAAIGAALAEPDARVVCVSGDGSMLINLQELATLAELDLNVTVLVLDNGHLGLVRQQQELFYEERYCASRLDSRTDFAAIARGFGLRAIDLADVEDLDAALASALSEPGPCFVRAPVHDAANVFPMVPPGKANREMIDGDGTPTILA